MELDRNPDRYKHDRQWLADASLRTMALGCESSVHRQPLVKCEAFSNVIGKCWNSKRYSHCFSNPDLRGPKPARGYDT